MAGRVISKESSSVFKFEVVARRASNRGFGRPDGPAERWRLSIMSVSETEVFFGAF